MADDFAVMILTHGRADAVVTDISLMKAGYTGKVYYIVDDLDDQVDRYKELYGEESVIVFDKMKYWRQLDTMMNRKQLAAVLYARQAAEDIAVELGLKTFCTIDDDIKGFQHRYIKGQRLGGKKVTNMDAVLEAYSKFVTSAGVACCCLGTPNLYMSGKASLLEKLPRKGSNVFIRNTSIPVQWMAAMNEDLITAMERNKVGTLMCTALPVMVQCDVCGTGGDGGMKKFYQTTTDYERSFYAVIADPARAYVRQGKNGSFTIARNWSGGDPEIINEKWRRQRE